jgi:hypothetical protein
MLSLTTHLITAAAAGGPEGKLYGLEHHEGRGMKRLRIDEQED